MNTLTRFVKEDDGQDLIEYAILLAIIVVAVIATASSIGTWVSTKFNDLNTELQKY